MWTYKTSVKWLQGLEGLAAAADRPDLTFTPPSEFGGGDSQWNPELLLVSAVEACLLLTTLSVAQRQKLNLKGYASDAVGHMEKTPEGLRFTKIDVNVRLQVGSPDEAEKAVKSVHIAEKYCPVSNAVKVPVAVTATVAP
jgi:organic hydroperoxide reductase OsmC/OhrA